MVNIRQRLVVSSHSINCIWIFVPVSVKELSAGGYPGAEDRLWKWENRLRAAGAPAGID
jgi:hypothetical protein